MYHRRCLMLYCMYIIIFIIFGSIVRLNIFLKTSYAVTIINYFLFGNLMIAFSFFLGSIFGSSRTATVVAFLYVFASGLLGVLLLQVLMDKNVNSGLVDQIMWYMK